MIVALWKGASRHFDENDTLDVHSLEALYGKESSFGKLMGKKNSRYPAGCFQIDPRLAKNLGLHVSKGNDERFDLDAASAAAAKHLKHLDDQFRKNSHLQGDEYTTAIRRALSGGRPLGDHQSSSHLHRGQALILIRSLLIGLFLCGAASKTLPGAHPGDRNQRCFEAEPSPDKRYLECIQSLNSVRALRKALPAYVKKLKDCPTCADDVIDGKLYQKAYRSSYLVIGSDALHMPTGQVVHVLFKNQPTQEYTIWMAYDEDHYTLRLVYRSEPERKLKKIIHDYYLKPEYKDFWIPIQ